jgi:ABC-2 type transport system ATP-binding protein
MDYTVRASGIRKAYGGQVVLDGVDLVLPTGSVFALLGPNGAGKTTMVRILATLVRPDAGSASVAGHDLLADPDGVRRSISLTGQFAAVDDMLTGRENLEMVSDLRRAGRARVPELLAEFDLTDAADRRTATYSGGMKRRLDLAICMIGAPQLVFLDEPTTGLDPRSREQLWGTVRRLVEDGVSILLTTQYLEEADQLADRIAMLDHGRVVAEGTADELKARLGGSVVRLEFATPAAYEAALGIVDGGGGSGAGGDLVMGDPQLRTIEVATDGSSASVYDVVRRLEARGVTADRVSTHRPSLDDVFMAVSR